MSNNRRAHRDDKRKGFQSDEVFSLLFTTINCGKFWRCIRWCDEGRAVLITSPMLFERDVLQREEWKLRRNVYDFAGFVDLLIQVGFEKILNHRPSKLQKFRHPEFKKDCVNQTVAEERAEEKRKRKLSEEDNFQLGAAVSKKDKNGKRSSAQKVKRQRNATFEDNSARTAKKRKRESTNGEEVSAHGKKRKSAVPDIRSVPTECYTSSQQTGRIYSAEEMTAAQALLSLSTPVVFANYSVMELMAAQGLINLSRSCVLPQGRSVRELEAAYALLELANSA